MNTLFVVPMNRPKLIYQFVSKVFPMVKQELNKWQRRAAQLPDASLRLQASESIRLKAFHCQGGSIFALYPGVKSFDAIQFIVAYQTMSDYLDNLVDSLEVQDELAFYQLHLAMQEALDPRAVLSDYYLYYPYRDDGGYLNRLVKTCQESLRKLPSYELVREEALELAKLYSHLQTYKHLALVDRESVMLNWIKPYLSVYSELTSWEFAAATGSTLGVFCLYAAAYNPQLSARHVEKIKQTYFPWICGLHILLDYFIDLREDKETNQLNFVAYYEDNAMTSRRLHLFIENSFKQAERLDYPKFHKAVVQGLLAMYLSDKKSMDIDIRSMTKYLLKASGLGVNLMYRLCCYLRKMKLL
ncbi:tetraprenyl-beta-curcumene synthase family protein [Desulfosporosinus sp. Sb-LF]|uniref:tetraprenyl-beta-curcumene synthase family protein n=1 Tax=Desulfosporosinus sp. Sb-LF TaxID=2560027 RepID=UPI00107FB222|nr:tetraprenyl-beta-curcumene synthase family protein [Desulfosporosinus sp. Sb-LF]TGE34464.1 tetraprenyl-beta-curcumene synthase family protein [Desulfosporosinus sp. Sb-LF]